MKKTVLILSGLLAASALAIPVTGKAIAPQVLAAGEGEVTIDKNHFPDEQFREYVRLFDKDGNGSFSQDELKKVTVINTQQYQISNLKGVEYFTSLKELDCSNANLSESGLDISRNTALVELTCCSCWIKKLDISKNTKLQSLQLENNELKSLDLSHNKELIWLNIYNTNLEELDISSNTKLQTLGVSDEAIQSLDLSNNKRLISLYVGQSKISKLDFSMCQDLADLTLSDMEKLTSVDISQNQKLESFCLMGITRIKPDFSKNPGLTCVICSDCGITSIDLSKNTKLEMLNVWNNPIRSLDLSNNTKLVSLDCGNTELTELDLSHCTELNDICITNTKIRKLDVPNPEKISGLYLSGSQIKDLELEKYPALEMLDCSVMNLESLDLSKCPKLTTVYCNENRLKTLNLSGCKKIRQLDCQENQLEELNLSDCVALEWLNCGYNKLKSLDVSSLKYLFNLDCPYNAIEKLDVSHNANLGQMNVFYNNLTELDLTHQKNWYNMNVAMNNLSEMPAVPSNTYIIYLPQKAHMQILDLRLASRKDNTIVIDWDSYSEMLYEEGITIEFEVWRSENPDSGFTQIDEATYQNTFEDRKARQSVTYYYKVRATLSDYGVDLIAGEFSKVLKVESDANGSVSFEDFVERLYTVALGRASEPEGKAFWVKQVVEEGKTGADCARFFLLDADEFMKRNLSVQDFVETLYATFFDRASDEAGKKGWVDAISSGAKTRAEVVNDFIESTEWCDVCATYGVKSGAKYHKATKASENAKNFATRLYTCCLKRAAEADGLRYWSLALTNLEQTGAQAAQFFFEGDEFVGLNTSNEEYLTRLYQTFMDRAPAADEVAFWIGEINAGRQNRHSILAFFAQSEEFTGICKQYGIERGQI